MELLSCYAHSQMEEFTWNASSTLNFYVFPICQSVNVAWPWIFMSLVALFEWITNWPWTEYAAVLWKKEKENAISYILNSLVRKPICCDVMIFFLPEIIKTDFESFIQYITFKKQRNLWLLCKVVLIECYSCFFFYLFCRSEIDILNNVLAGVLHTEGERGLMCYKNNKAALLK